jgi:hypothetical protein
VHPSLLPIHTTCPAHLILLDLITRTIFGKEYRSFSSSLCNFLHSPVTSSLSGPNTPLNTLFSNTLSLRDLRFVLKGLKELNIYILFLVELYQHYDMSAVMKRD